VLVCLQGVCHRDLRVENLMLDNKGNLKITDFGHAGIFEHGWDVFQTMLVGSVSHLAPEQVKHRTLGTAGKPPYLIDTRRKVIVAGLPCRQIYRAVSDKLFSAYEYHVSASATCLWQRCAML
jgi:serine/threonine protein kinase